MYKQLPIKNLCKCWNDNLHNKQRFKWRKHDFFEVKLWFVSCFVHNNVKRLKITMETRNPFDDGNDFSIHNRELVVNMLLCILKLRTKKIEIFQICAQKTQISWKDWNVLSWCGHLALCLKVDILVLRSIVYNYYRHLCLTYPFDLETKNRFIAHLA